MGVYLMKTVGCRPVRYKIGITRFSADHRRDNVASGPFDVEVVAFKDDIPGEDRYYEAELHRLFSKNRVHREWFEFDNGTLRDVLTHYEHGAIRGDHVDFVGLCAVRGSIAPEFVDAAGLGRMISLAPKTISNIVSKITLGHEPKTGLPPWRMVNRHRRWLVSDVVRWVQMLPRGDGLECSNS